jgi:aconitate hydratase
MFIADASQRYQDEGTPLMVIGGSEYGQGSARDWAAKGTALLGVSYNRSSHHLSIFIVS